MDRSDRSDSPTMSSSNASAPHSVSRITPTSHPALYNYAKQTQSQWIQGSCSANDCVPFWIFAVLVCIQVVSIFAFAKTIDKDTGTVRPASFMEKVKSTFKTLLIDLVLGAAIFYFCRKCNNDWAWFVLFLPVILMGLLFFVFVGSVSMLGREDLPPKVILASPVE